MSLDAVKVMWPQRAVCVLRWEDLEQKGGDAPGSAARNMLSIKRTAINTRYTAPGRHKVTGVPWEMEEAWRGVKGNTEWRDMEG